MNSYRNQLQAPKPIHFNEAGRIYLGAVEVKLNRMFIFGSQQKLHEMVSFIPGMGNGCYEVYGEVREVPGHGFRMVKIEIECITPEEIKHYEQKYADHVMEVAF